MTQPEIIEEYNKGYYDISYYASKYMSIKDTTKMWALTPVNLFPKQKGLLDHYQKNRFSIVKKTRQMGGTTITAIYCAHRMLFATKRKRESILIISTNIDMASHFIQLVASLIKSAPEWLTERDKHGEVKFTKNNRLTLELPNGSHIKGKTTSADALCGHSPTLLVLEEAAFLEHSLDTWTAALPTIAIEGRAIILSSPNGTDKNNLFHKLYKDSLSGINDFKIFEMYWYEDPRFNKDFRWVKKIKLFSGETFEDIVRCTDPEKFVSLKLLDYKPTNEWYEGMCKNYCNDTRKVENELNAEFV